MTACAAKFCNSAICLSDLLTVDRERTKHRVTLAQRDGDVSVRAGKIDQRAPSRTAPVVRRIVGRVDDMHEALACQQAAQGRIRPRLVTAV
jgi:hypothetical protein